jgi:hypothetical protein
MTFEPSPPIDLTPTTTRVGSGTSARLIALAVAAVLVGVVGYALVNRPPSPPPAVAAATATPEPPPTPLPTPSPPRNQLEGNDGIFSWAVVAQLPLDRPGAQSPTLPPIQRYAVAMEITGGRLRLILEPGPPEVYAGSLVIESAFVGPDLGIELGLQRDQGGLSIFQQFGAWDVATQHLRKSRGAIVTMLVEHVPPNTTPGVLGLVATGYTFTVVGRRDGTSLTLRFELVWPPTAQIGAYAGPRGPGLFNRCRWEVGPQAAPPRGNEDEAGCLET